MDTLFVEALVWVVAVSSGLMAGTYFAFSGFIMTAFANLEGAQGMAAMNAINRTILKSPFMPLFFGSTGAAVLLTGAGLWSWAQPGALQAVIAGLLYTVGMFVITAVVNVPLNNQLAAAEGSTDAETCWQHYLRRWTRWNSLRALASLATCVVCGTLLTHC